MAYVSYLDSVFLFVGCLGIVDSDIVELNNLHRQVCKLVFSFSFYLFSLISLFSLVYNGLWKYYLDFDQLQDV